MRSRRLPVRGVSVYKRNLNWITWGFVALAVVIVALMLSRSLRRTAHITLPEPGGGADVSAGSAGTADGLLTLVEITPETVQAAIASLERPERYRRTVTVEQFWKGGSGRYDTAVTVSGAWSRMDRTMPDGQVRHSLTDGRETYIWYNEEEAVFTAPAGGITADDEQSIPTYEDILELPPEAIVEADYRMLLNVSCVYVETAEDPAGYALRYWVSVNSGLLVAAEKLLNGETVYRMGAPDGEETDLPELVLPDGSPLPED